MPRPSHFATKAWWAFAALLACKPVSSPGVGSRGVSTERGRGDPGGSNQAAAVPGALRGATDPTRGTTSTGDAAKDAAKGLSPRGAGDEPSAKRLVPRRVVAFGDVHGDLEATLDALRLAHAVDDQARWTGGDLVVVQTGDQLDRGDDERAILELFDRLAREAGTAGGAFVALNGNHELMNVALEFRDVTAGGQRRFDDLATPELLARVADRPEAERARAAVFRPGAPMARLLAKRDVVAVVGTSVFVHGGLRPEHVARGIDRTNREVRAWLEDDRYDAREIFAFIMSPESPVWTRRYSQPADGDLAPEVCREVAQTLRAVGVSRMVVGHTVQRTGITSACGETVWRIDVGLARIYGGPTEVLSIEGDRVQVLRRG